MIKFFKKGIITVAAASAVLLFASCASTSDTAAAEPVAAPVDQFEADMAALVEIPAISAEASAWQESKGLVGANAIDGDMETTWTVEGKANVVIDLGAVSKVAAIDVATKKGNERKYEMMFEGSVDGVTYMPLTEEVKSSGRSEDMERYDVINAEIQYVKVNVYGAGSASAWNNVKEIKVYGIQ